MKSQNVHSCKVFLLYLLSAVLLISSLLFSLWQSSAQAERKDIRDNGQKTTAYAVSRKEVQFRTPDGEVTTKPIVAPLQGTLKKFDVISIYYYKENPERGILDQVDSGFNLTRWIVVARLFGGSLILFCLAFRM